LELANRLKDKSDSENYNTWVNDYLDTVGEEAVANATEKKLLDGADSPVYEISLDPTLSKSLDVTGKGWTPDHLYVSEKGTYYPVYTDDDGKVDVNKSKPLSKQQMVLSLGGRTVTKTKLGSEVKGTSVEKIQTIPSASRSEWKAAGWTDAQINEQVEKGKIKVK